MPASMAAASRAASALSSWPDEAMEAARPASSSPTSAWTVPPKTPRPSKYSSFARESARSRFRIVSCPIRSAGSNAASSVRSIDSRSGW